MTREITGTWHNQHGSEMALEVDAGGRITGSFRSGVGFPAPEETFPITGFAAGDLVAFTVHFGGYESLTAWTGHYQIERGGVERIETLWHMTVHVPRGLERSSRWKATWSGTDVFLRRPRPAGAEEAGRHPSHPTPGSRP